MQRTCVHIAVAPLRDARLLLLSSFTIFPSILSSPSSLRFPFRLSVISVLEEPDALPKKENDAPE